ncbi:MAG: hypothetical protein HY438_04025 [DPANN group archaeon]|nr:hypothetical protein [DPANN group archaeon]
MGKLAILNIVLLIAALVLLLNLAGPADITANVVYALDKSEPKCIFEYQGSQSAIDDINQCCFELQQQRTCSQDGAVNSDYACSTSDYGAKYTVNTKAINYCKTQGYRIKLK